ncbi:MAG TPA: hypothetical protein VHZ74_03455 [Bryobacteraceae bacterium]|nr:hypothetical protein [Bryobacteraceae bacterium]
MTSRRAFFGIAAAASAGFGFSAESTTGLIFPAANPTLPLDARALYPKGVRFLTAGVDAGHTLPESLSAWSERIKPAARRLVGEGASAIVIMAPAVSFYRGNAFNQILSDQVAHETGVPSITASTAAVEGLRSVRARRVAVATVYTQEISLHLQGFLEESGFEVVAVRGLGVERFEESPAATEGITGEDFMQFCVKVRESRPEADALLICGGHVPTLAAIVPMEKRCQIPVVSATPHSLRAGVKLAGGNWKVAGFGTLLDR